MKSIFYILLFYLLLSACSKQNTTSGNANPSTGNHPAANGSATPASSNITVYVNNEAVPVTSISFDRSSSTFNFSAQNAVKKVDVKCFWFYQQSGFNYQYSDSINYSYRTDTLSGWNTIRAINYGDVYFDCCQGPLTDKLITGNYSGNFGSGDIPFTVKGNFSLLFK
ncbi:MAG: hypothetical protein EKK37_02590 [Sphingobacteriales bacterium]|nr:MAG: hypothetical protein EKK37_02590 [Sphingobacteriales bacterium]